MDRVKLTEEQVSKLKEFQAKSTDMVFALGQIEMQRINFDFLKENLKKDLEELNQEQNEMASTLETEHGPGQIDFETGEYVKFQYTAPEK